jgi:sporulation protein YlmC with PRC-barrel domain
MKTFRKEDVVGKTVIETSGAVKGKVVDVIFDLGGTVTLMVRGTDGKEFEVTTVKVTGISEHVVVRSDQATESAGSGVATTCKFCGAAKAPEERWCPSCGRSQT